MLQLVAILRRTQDGQQQVLSAQSLVGRSPACRVMLGDPYASSEHAKISWSGSVWQLRDLGSRNGTFVDGHRLQPGTPHVLRTGCKLGFGEDEDGWELIDDAAPGAMATDLEDSTVHLAVGELLTLPNDDAPLVSVYPANEGGGWVVEDAEGETTAVHDQSVLAVGERSFRLDLPVLSEATPMVDVALNLENVGLRMAVSQDEETVITSVLLRGEECAKLESREHSYLLLTLARARIEDSDKPPPERGWIEVEEILRMLKIDQNMLNVAIHRARQQLAATGLEGAAGIVQTRRGRRRFGTDKVEITRLES